MRAFRREGGIFINSTLKTLSTVANMLSILRSISFMCSCAVRRTGRSVRVVFRKDDKRVELRQTFFFKLLNEKRQPALSQLLAQLLLGAAALSRVFRASRRHLLALLSPSQKCLCQQIVRVPPSGSLCHPVDDTHTCHL